LLLKRSKNLSDELLFCLRDLLRCDLKTSTYLLKEAFQQLWDYSASVWASKFLDEWCCQTMHSRIEPMNKIARIATSTPRTHPQLLPGAKTDFQRRGEGLNNKAKSP
jgi:hypothetical protein